MYPIVFSFALHNNMFCILLNKLNYALTWLTRNREEEDSYFNFLWFTDEMKKYRETLWIWIGPDCTDILRGLFKVNQVYR